MNDKPFSCKMSKLGETIVLELSGALNEKTDLVTLPQSAKAVRIKMHGLSNVNSAGIRQWCQWIAKLPPGIDVQIEGSPYSFLKCLSLIQGVVTEKTVIESLYVPFFSPRNDEEKMVLLQREKHFFEDGRLILPEVSSDRGEPMILDDSARVYLRGVGVTV